MVEKFSNNVVTLKHCRSPDHSQPLGVFTCTVIMWLRPEESNTNCYIYHVNSLSCIIWIKVVIRLCKTWLTKHDYTSLPLKEGNQLTLQLTHCIREFFKFTNIVPAFSFIMVFLFVIYLTSFWTLTIIIIYPVFIHIFILSIKKNNEWKSWNLGKNCQNIGKMFLCLAEILETPMNEATQRIWVTRAQLVMCIVLFCIVPFALNIS